MCARLSMHAHARRRACVPPALCALLRPRPAHVCTTAQVGLAWLDRWAANLAGKDDAPVVCHQISSLLLAAETTGLYARKGGGGSKGPSMPTAALLHRAAPPPLSHRLLACRPAHLRVCAPPAPPQA
jgi:hypothetical protein